jgi:hypothetical protein
VRLCRLRSGLCVMAVELHAVSSTLGRWKQPLRPAQELQERCAPGTERAVARRDQEFVTFTKVGLRRCLETPLFMTKSSVNSRLSP